MSTIGVAMIAQNEENHIAVSLAQFYHVVDDIVVVDGGSTDKTSFWAERMGARLFHRPFEFDFADQKNFAISQLQTDWVYLHDPDERLEPTLIEMFPYLIEEEGQKIMEHLGILPPSGESFDCFGIPRKNFIDGLAVGPFPDYQYRLFRNYCRLEGKVHEEIVNFKKRTEMDYLRKNWMVFSDPDLPNVATCNNDETPRFSILHYKSSERQAQQNALYAKISGGQS